MPSRRSDRGRALAAALRENPEEKLALAAEFTEPYGTIASIDRISEGDADVFDYMAAIPVAGLPARYAKRFKKIQEAVDEAKKFKSREVVTEMDIDDFLDLAKKGYDPGKAKGLKEVEQFDDVPYLNIERFDDGTKSRVVGHEGRHRAMRLKELGEKTMPVRLKDSSVRWDQQDAPGTFDYQDYWPDTLESESGDMLGDFPVKRGQWGAAERSGPLNMRSLERRPVLERKIDEALETVEGSDPEELDPETVELLKMLGID